MRPAVLVTCPPIPKSFDLSCNAIEQTLGRMLQEHGPVDPLACFGNELRWAYLLSGSDSHPRVLPQLERLRSRPAIEPILFKRWGLFRKWQFTPDGINRLVSDLAGTAMFLRTEPVFSGPNPPVPYVEFPAPASVDTWVNAVAALGNDSSYSPITLASLLYASTVLNHPYRDGNGRLARALVHAALANRVNYTCPFLPIGPAFLMYRETAVIESLSLSKTGDWGRFTSYFASRLEFALRLYESENKRASARRS